MLLQGHPPNLEPLPTTQVSLDQNKKIHRAGAMLRLRTTLDLSRRDASNLVKRRLQTFDPGKLPAIVRQTSVLKEYSTVVAEDLMGVVQQPPMQGFAMNLPGRLWLAPQQQPPQLHIVLEAWGLVASVVRAVTQP